MTRRCRVRGTWLPAAALALLLAAPGPAVAQGGDVLARKGEVEGLTPETVRELYRQYAEPLGRGRVGPLAVPDVFGHGNVLTVGKVVQKITNFGWNGNPFQNFSTDPSAQWPGQSGVEYLFGMTILVGGVNPGISPGDPVSRRRVSSGIEWRPPTLAPEDRIYPAYEGIVNGIRFSNDDGDKDQDEPITYLQDKVDEDFLDGRDNDGDGRIDEDYGALGQQMYSFVMRDDTEEAIRFTFAEPHVPVGIEIRERAWAYSLTQVENFNVMEYRFTNVSGHEIDSLYVGMFIDADAGPVTTSNYFVDDLDQPQFPSGHFTLKLEGDDSQEPRLQKIHSDQIRNIPYGTPLCPQLDIRINGFSFADDNGDEGRTLGVPTFLVFDHTVDPLGKNGPPRVGFRAFRSFGDAAPFAQGGPPRIDQQRFEFMTGRAAGDQSAQPLENVNPETGFLSAPPGDQKGDFQAFCSMGPWLHLQPGASITLTAGYAVQRGKTGNPYAELIRYPGDYTALKEDSLARPGAYMDLQADLFSDYPGVKTAFDAQVAFEGVWEARGGRDGLLTTDFHGRETPIRGPSGSAPTSDLQDCRDINEFDGRFRQVKPDEYTWFDFDCNYCTGVWSSLVGEQQPDDQKYLGGFFHKTWNASAPPPSPATNTGTTYNFADNPVRTVAAAGDRQITLAWDNGSQIAPDPGEYRDQKGVFDFRGYSIYKVAGWTRPVGSPGPAENEWALVASFTLFDYRDADGKYLENNAIGRRTDGSLIFPAVLYPNKRCDRDPDTDDDGDSCEVRLYPGDLWDKQSGLILSPDRSLPCVKWGGVDPCFKVVASGDTCEAKCGVAVHAPMKPDTLAHYPVGLYRYVDKEVKNGFQYFYSVTAFDSVCTKFRTDGRCGLGPDSTLSAEGRKSAVEAEGVAPQAATMTGKQVWVVPNPYKGYQQIAERPSTWDLTPNATDPTGTHIDFMGLPPGQWTIRIYTVSGDLVQELRSSDPVNESTRGPVETPTGIYPGYNRQQDTANDGQASWNLISRNGQDIVSGVYLFTVDSSEGIQRGRFVVIR